MKKMLKIGLVGFGGAGMAQYGHFNAIKGCRVTAVFDPGEAGRNRAKQSAKTATPFANFEEFLASDIDAVSICSPDSTHAHYVVRSLDAGKHILCEKPLTDSLEGIAQIMQALERHPHLVAAVQHQMRFLPIHQEMRKLIQKKALGNIFYIEGYYVHNLTERAGLYHPWRFQECATPLVYSGCHFIDLMRWLLNDEVVEVTGMANNIGFPAYPESDFNVVLLKFRSGIIGKVVVAFGAARPQDHSVRIYGTEKSIENNILFSKDGNFNVFCRPHLRQGVLRPQKIGRLFLKQFFRTAGAVITSKLFEGLMRLYRGSHEYALAAYPLRLYEHGYAVRQSILDFVNTIQNGGTVQCPLIDAAKTVAVCLAGVEAYRTGTTVLVKNFWPFPKDPLT